MNDKLPIQNLSIRAATKRAFDDAKVTSLEHIAEVCKRTGLSPSRLLRRDIKGFGNVAFCDFFDALFRLAIQQSEKSGETPPVHSGAALQLVGQMIANTTGDIGGRDQAKIFAEIAYDMIEAVQQEAAKRRLDGAT